MKKILLYFLLFSFLYGNNVGIPDNTCALIVASRQTKADVKAYIDENITFTKYVTLYQANNGWYAIALGFLKDNESKSVMRRWKNSGKIPYDSFCTHGDRFVKEVFLDKDHVNYSYNHSQSTGDNSGKSSQNHTIKELKCMVLTWGPDVCSKKFSEYAENNDNIDDVSDIIKSPACTSIVSKMLGEEATADDIEVATVTGALDQASESSKSSDSDFVKFLGEVAYVYSFGIKLSLFINCMNK